jgi:pyruvate kinase
MHARFGLGAHGVMLLCAAGIRDTEETVAIAAVNAAYSQNAAAIICLTTSGRTAAYVSKYRPQCPVLTVTRKERVTRQLHLYRSIFPMRCAPALWDHGFGLASVSDHSTMGFGARVDQSVVSGKRFVIAMGVGGWLMLPDPRSNTRGFTLQVSARQARGVPGRRRRPHPLVHRCVEQNSDH